MLNLDNGYVSNYLIHWTGKDSDEKGFNTLLDILRDNRLRFGSNEFVRLGLSTSVAEVRDEMVCFTDVPIRYSHEHCMKYGKFGIAFGKQFLASKGAQPVFYYTPFTMPDVIKIIRFTIEPGETTVIPQDIMKALRRHFYFSQPYSNDSFASRHASFYEREWRLGEQNLDENFGEGGVVYKRALAGEARPLGKLMSDDKYKYFPFKVSDVSFVVVPQVFEAKLRDALPMRQFCIMCYEDLVSTAIENNI